MMIGELPVAIAAAGLSLTFGVASSLKTADGEVHSDVVDQLHEISKINTPSLALKYSRHIGHASAVGIGDLGL